MKYLPRNQMNSSVGNQIHQLKQKRTANEMQIIDLENKSAMMRR